MDDATDIVTPREIKSWADEAEEEEALEEANAVSSSTLELNIEDLKIEENMQINKFLDDPDDSSIQAVCG